MLELQQLADWTLISLLFSQALATTELRTLSFSSAFVQLLTRIITMADGIRQDDGYGKAEVSSDSKSATAPSPYDIRGSADDAVGAGQIDPVYEAKARVLNHAACAI